MSYFFWDLTYSDHLRVCIEQISSQSQRNLFLKIFERMGEYVTEHDDAYAMTFKEYFDRFER